ncbi:MAG TPA: tetratricopeptide repeat protein, partial [Gemmataceae bacterium]|nr:tetratricopeptide repeat protein [Gemmataceae bacterium]
LRKEPGRRYATARDLADDLRRFQAGEPVRARPVGTAERVVVWCRRKPAVAGLLAALVLVFLAGGAGVLWQWRRATRERDLARQEQDRAQRHLHMVRDRVDRLNTLGSDLLLKPGQYRAGQAVLEEALGFYQELLPEEGNDPAVRREAAQLFRKVAQIRHTLGHAGEAAEAREREVALLASLLKEEPANTGLRLDLAISQRWRGNALRDLDKTREARGAYDRAAELLEGLLRDDPGNAEYQSELSNTLLNTASLLSYRSQADELESLYRRTLELDRAAVRAAPDSPQYQAELALSLGDQGLLFLNTGRGPRAEAAVRESIEVNQRVLAGGHLKGVLERYVGRNYASLGRILAAAGRTEEAEQSYRKAVSLLEPLVAEMPESGIRRAELARALYGLAGFLKDAGRRREAAEVQLRVIGQFETLAADCPENPEHLRCLVQTYLDRASLLCELGEETGAAEPYRKAVGVESEDPVVNNKLAWFLATTAEPRFRNPAEAVRLAKKVVTARPESGYYRNTLGVAHYRNGEDRAAVAELEAAMRMRAGGDCCDWFFLAMSHWRLGERDEARAWFDRAVRGMERDGPHDGATRRFHAEAEALLGAEASKR